MLASSLKGLVTVKEAAALLGVSEMTCRRLLWEGRLGKVKIGAAVRIPRADLDAYIAANYTAPRAAR